MSFSGMVKEELSRQTSTARHCRIAETAALLSACGRITKDGSLRFQTENNAVVRKYFTLLQKTFNIDTEIAIRESSMLKKGNVYHVEITDLLQVQNVLQGTKLSVNEADRGTLFLENGLITQQNCCKRAFVRGAFLASGSISDPEKGYHFEIVCQDEVKAGENFVNQSPFVLVLVFLVIGFAFLIKGADFFVEGSSSIARKLKVPSIIIGLTIVAMGTSLPAGNIQWKIHTHIWFFHISVLCNQIKILNKIHKVTLYISMRYFLCHD